MLLRAIEILKGNVIIRHECHKDYCFFILHFSRMVCKCHLSHLCVVVKFVDIPENCQSRFMILSNLCVVDTSGIDKLTLTPKQCY